MFLMTVVVMPMQIVLMKFSVLFLICVRFCCWMPGGFGSVCFSLAVGGYMWQQFYGIYAQCPKSVFLGKNGKNYENRPILATKF